MRKFFISLLILLPTLVFAASPVSTYGPTAKNEQLWQIAIAVRPNASVSIQQTMVALLQANPTAFKDGNISGLKPKSLLNIPSIDEIQKNSLEAASEIVAQQEKTWNSIKGNQVKIQKKINPKNSKELLAAYKANNNDLLSLQTQLVAVGDLIQTIDQQYQVRLANLEKHNLGLQNQLQQLNAKNKVNISVDNQLPLPVGSFIKIGGLLLIIILAVYFLLIYQSRSREKDEENLSEYDFMGSREGIPAKLDLARAYVDMGDVESAKEVLAEILKNGSIDQQSEAREILVDIEK
ncbi:MAG: hypothetical protein JXR42_04965 [Gammaproteobacteria bacterium]|nr:hypothetical protein [Gammaproteobacteria bacterium]